ncbi:ran-specific GTPase-activating protein-like [Cylas formicarius]|uniref:ran-specific GTPase-activating protein-like n=1 Tax=Cylas formicarius TaxID=197179 RepID=UPI0029586580|nr:ran-specific GTPase-activating protein-like [Cylas formicarius]
MSEISEVLPQTPEREHKQSESSDTEYDVHYSPIISLPEVQVSLNEDDETEFLKIRAKLYRFDSLSEPAEWKERGTGELKILRHNENSSFRIVMRRDKTLKVCANHFITPWMELKPNSTNKKAFIYTVLGDFADEQVKSECLAVKFGSMENANLFKNKFEEAKKILKIDCDLYNGKVDKLINDSLNESLTENRNNEEAEEITKKLTELEVTNEDEKEE